MFVVAKRTIRVDSGVPRRCNAVSLREPLTLRARTVTPDRGMK